MWKLLLFGMLPWLASANRRNVCQKQISYTVKETQPYTASRTVSSEYFCISHFICQRFKTIYYTAYREVSVEKFSPVNVCCPGWIGENCDIACAPGYHGENCTRLCVCQNEASCLPADGSCVCSSGFYGPHCENACNPGYYGHYCQSTCGDLCPEKFCNNKLGCVTPSTASTTSTNPPITLGSTEKANSTEFSNSEVVEAPEDDTLLKVGSQISEHGASSDPKKETKSNHFVNILLPICLTVLVALLIVFLLILRRRRRLPAMNHSITYLPAQVEEVDNRQNDEVYYCPALVQASGDLTKKIFADERGPCTSYRSHMNDLNKAEPDSGLIQQVLPIQEDSQDIPSDDDNN